MLDGFGPVDAVLEDGDGVRMRAQDDGQDAPVRAVQLGVLDAVQLGVAPVEAARRLVDGQAVGPAELRVDQPAARRTVQAADADVRRSVAPVAPEQQPPLGVHGHAARSLQSALYPNKTHRVTRLPKRRGRKGRKGRIGQTGSPMKTVSLHIECHETPFLSHWSDRD